MKYSIKRQMMTVFVGLILFMIVVFMIVNGSFLEKYYISNKKSEFIKEMCIRDRIIKRI